ncbi:MAG UNVERIFIED_CONTAM: conjugal transfer protein TraX [Rickettsiaceae bacterium]|jgi:hypothetical protein
MIRISRSVGDQSNYQDLLKLLALVIMLVDHFGLYFDPENIWIRVIGRFAAPIFAFYAGYNFHGRIRHMIWVYGVLLILAHYIVLDIFMSNILVSIAFGQLYLSYAGNAILQSESRFLRHFLAMIILTPITYQFIDYGTLAIAFMQVGYLVANKKADKGHLLFAIMCLAIFNQYLVMYDTIPLFLSALLFVLLSYIFLASNMHNSSIPVKLTSITRNILYIYTITTLGYIIAVRFLL